MYLIRINVPGTLSTLVYTTLVFVFFVTYILNTHFFLSTKKTYYFLISLFSSISLLDGPWTSVSRELLYMNIRRMEERERRERRNNNSNNKQREPNKKK